MDQFTHVMIMISILLGIGIAHILIGVGGIIQRLTGQGEKLRLGLAYISWLGFVFTWMAMLWWWEYRLAELDVTWTIALYFFLVSYVVSLFLLAVVLIPRSWDDVEDLDAFFIQKRVWFYSILFVATALDVIDSLYKGGWEYLLETGPYVWGITLATIPVCIIGIRSVSVRTHTIFGIAFFLWQFFFVAFGEHLLLGFGA